MSTSHHFQTSITSLIKTYSSLSLCSLLQLFRSGLQQTKNSGRPFNRRFLFTRLFLRLDLFLLQYGSRMEKCNVNKRPRRRHMVLPGLERLCPSKPVIKKDLNQLLTFSFTSEFFVRTNSSFQLITQYFGVSFPVLPHFRSESVEIL